jgi:hypothetical protein
MLPATLQRQRRITEAGAAAPDAPPGKRRFWMLPPWMLTRPGIAPRLAALRRYRATLFANVHSDGIFLYDAATGITSSGEFLFDAAAVLRLDFLIVYGTKGKIINQGVFIYDSTQPTPTFTSPLRRRSRAS